MSTRLFILVSLFTCFCSNISVSHASQQQATCSGQRCVKEAHNGVLPGGEIYQIVAPLGKGTVQPIRQAKRLDTLEGKTIAIVGGSFMASVTHPELKRLIMAEFPNAKVFVLNEIGSAGVFPGPGIRRRSVEDFQASLKHYRVDAVISGNGGCGLCTPKETGSSIAAEYLGIPSVTIAGPGFTDQVKITASNNGVPIARVAKYPGAFTEDSREKLIENTQKILWPQIKEALTRPLSEKERTTENMVASEDSRTTVYSGTLDDVNQYFSEMNWSDGLPIIPPTLDRIQPFLKFGGVKYNTPVATLPIAHRQTLAIHVAANGVMAGCKPEYMPILLSLTKALGDPEFRRTLASTHAWNPFCWLNGPLARQLGIDCGQGEISEEANVSIGRFMNLALKNLSGYYIKADRMGTFGYLMPWCLVEDEEACAKVGWRPHHVQQGFKPNDNTITVASALMWGNNMAPSTDDAKKVMQLTAWDISERCQFALGSGKQFTYRTILMTEPVASILSKEYANKETFEEALIKNARRPLYERTYANYFANPGSRISPTEFPFTRYESRLARTEEAQVTPLPEWYALPEGTEAASILTVATMKPHMTAILVTGDKARNKLQVMPGGAYATYPISLPSNWDEMMKKAGYQPLSHFTLSSAPRPEVGRSRRIR